MSKKIIIKLLYMIENKTHTMLKKISVISLTIWCSFFLNQNIMAQTYSDTLTIFRSNYKAEIKELFVNVTQDFFEIDQTFKMEAEFKKTKSKKSLILETSSNQKKQYRVFATVTGRLNGNKISFEVYQMNPINPAYKNHVFFPFKDKTNKITSYGGGRYIDLDYRDFKNNKILIDFNKAYNPYCAFSDGYSCPIPPIGNHLNLEIQAGEKTPKKQEN